MIDKLSYTIGKNLNGNRLLVFLIRKWLWISKIAFLIVQLILFDTHLGLLAYQTGSSNSQANPHGSQYYSVDLASGDQNRVQITTSTFDPFSGVFYGYNEQNGLLIKVNKQGLVVLDSLDSALLGEVRMQFIPDPDRLAIVDAGLGRVFVYDLLSSSFSRVDNSYDFRSFFGFGGYSINDLDIYTMGGYGEFRHKNAYLRYYQDMGEWAEISTSGDIPKPEGYGFLYYVNKTTAQVYYIVPNSSGFRVYVLDRPSGEWSFLGNFDIELPPNELGYYLNYFTNHRQVGSLLHIRGNVFYDYIANEIKIWKGGFDNIAGIYAVSETADSLYCIHSKSGRSTSIYSHDLVVERLSMEPFLVESNYESFRPRHQILWTYGIMLFIAVAGVLTVVLIVRSPRELRLKSYAPITFHADRVEVQSSYADGKVVFFDELDIIFWKYLQQILEQNIQKISLEELDDILFKGLVNPTQRSSKRSKLISRINKELGHDFLTVERTESDKRRKLINIDWDVLL